MELLGIAYIIIFALIGISTGVMSYKSLNAFLGLFAGIFLAMWIVDQLYGSQPTKFVGSSYETFTLYKNIYRDFSTELKFAIKLLPVWMIAGRLAAWGVYRFGSDRKETIKQKKKRVYGEFGFKDGLPDHFKSRFSGFK